MATTTTPANPTGQPWKYLQFVEFRNLGYWDYFTNFKKVTWTSPFSVVELREVLTWRKEFIAIENNTTYKRCRVQLYGKGVVLRDEAKGAVIKTKKQQLCRPDDFLVAEIDAKFGGYGIVPPDLNGAIVSGHYFLFEIDQSRLLPEFLALVVKQPRFAEQVQATGSTNYAAIRAYHVFEYKIPLPTLAEQRQLVAAYHAKTQQAQQQRAEAGKVIIDAENYLMRELGVSIEASTRTSGKLNFVNFADLDRWDTAYALRAVKMKSAYPKASISDFFAHFMRDADGGTVRINTADFAVKSFYYIGMEHVEKNTGRLVDAALVKGKELKSQTLRIPPGFFIYGKLRPYLNKYWRNNTDQKDVVCSSEFFTFDLNDKINPDYFLTVLRSEIIQQQIQDNTSGARMPRMNESTFLNLKIPVPDTAKQADIVQVFEYAAKLRNDLQASADALEAAAVGEFEADIFISQVSASKLIASQ